MKNGKKTDRGTLFAGRNGLQKGLNCKIKNFKVRGSQSAKEKAEEELKTHFFAEPTLNRSLCYLTPSIQVS